MTTITIERALLEQALEALELVTEDYDDSAVGLEIEAIQALRAALAAPAAESDEQLRKDAERLDCLEALHASKMKTDAHFGGSMSAVFYQRTGIGSNIRATGYGPTVRGAIDAIDAAMKG